MPYKDKNSPAAKESMARRNKTYYEKNRDKIISYKKKWKKKYYIENRDKWVNGYNAKTTMTRRLRMFGVSEDDYNELFKNQSGGCAICGKHQNELSRSLCVDHCHDTGKIRGLLCSDCNVGIGRLKDSLENLKNAIEYLK